MDYYAVQRMVQKMKPQKDHAPMVKGEEKVRANAKEGDAIKILCGIFSVFQDSMPAMERRLKSIPGGWRDLKMLSAVTYKLMEKIFITMPTDQLESLRKALDSLKVSIKYSPLSSVQDGDIAVRVEHLDVVMNAAHEGKCWFCSNNHLEARKCKLRAVLDALSFCDEPEVNGCRYRGVIDPLEGADHMKEMAD